ncbi:MAG: chemotaxis protein CheC [Planctomycetota bacterium]
MTAHDDSVLTEGQLEAFRTALHAGAAEASLALSRWIHKTATVRFDAVEQLPLRDATTVLGVGEEPICFCIAQMKGRLAGQLILAFDDDSGLALADMLLGQPQGTAAAWGEMETSAALETANILYCAYLNALSRAFGTDREGASELLPSPPRFSREFAESLVQFALMGQIVATDHVLLARTQFHIDGVPVDWTLLLVPDAESMSRLGELLEV